MIIYVWMNHWRKRRRATSGPSVLSNCVIQTFVHTPTSVWPQLTHLDVNVRCHHTLKSKHRREVNNPKCVSLLARRSIEAVFRSTLSAPINDTTPLIVPTTHFLIIASAVIDSVNCHPLTYIMVCVCLSLYVPICICQLINCHSQRIYQQLFFKSISWVFFFSRNSCISS